jgi:hypothetical protein
MSKYLLVYRGGSMPEAQEEQAKAMAAWGAWFGQLGSAVADQGNPSSQSKTISPNGTVSGDGHPSISGYSIISADSLEAAVALARGCPVLHGGASIEVVETADIM